jgi:Transposase, Mutator family
MTVTASIDPARLLEEQLAQASPDLLRQLLQTFINTLLSAEADAVCGAAYGTTSELRTNRRNGYRHVISTPGRARSMSRSPSCARARTSPSGCWSVQAGRAGADVGGGDVLPARRQHSAHGQARAESGDHRTVQVAGLRHGRRA